MNSLYQRFLWFLGVKEGETFSAMMKRQWQRMGDWWFAFPITTILAILAGIAWCIYWLVSGMRKHQQNKSWLIAPICLLTFLILLLGFCGWLFYHILTFKEVED